MTENQAVNQVQVQENKPSDKELNFRAVEAKHRREMAEMQSRLEEAEKKAQEAARRQQDEDEDDDAPYVEPKKLEKKLDKFGQKTKTEIQQGMESVKQAAKEEIKQEMWLESHPDFYDTMQLAGKLYEKDREMAETILRMPDNFDRQKLVYKSIKGLGLDKPEPKQSSVQDKIDANRRSPYYQPSGIGTAPYQSMGDFSEAGKKNAHAKMKELQSRLRI